MYNIYQYTQLIALASANFFTVKEIKTQDIIYFKNWFPKYYKLNYISDETKMKKDRNSEVQFSLSKYHHFIYKEANIVKVSEFVNGLYGTPFRIYDSLEHPDQFLNFLWTRCTKAHYL